jgi:hypothetical protein
MIASTTEDGLSRPRARGFLLCVFVGVAVLAGSVGATCVQAQTPAYAPSPTYGPTHAEVETGASATTGAAPPFWLHANTDGLVDPTSSGGWVRGAVRRALDSDGRWSYGYGLEGVARLSDRETAYLSEAYVEARYGFLRARVGRKPDVIGEVAHDLTSGSLGTSRNATPIPKIVLATDGYTGVPFTGRWMEFKGQYTHGWMSDDRVTTGAYLHQKTLYLRVGTPSPVQVHAGLVHNAMWGGTTPVFGRLPQSFEDYARTVVALNGSEDAPPGEEAYIQGNHLGVIDVGLSAEVGTFELQAYRQFIYEDRDNLKLKSPQDGLLGVAVVDEREERWMDRLVYEYLYTKWQNGPFGPSGTERGGAGGQDNYYNHYIYESGWTLYGRTAGSPLLTPFSDGRPGIANNRVVAHHLGVAGHAGPVRYRVMATYSRNYGTYGDEDAAQRRGEEYRFNPRLDQASVLVGARMPWPSDDRFVIRASVGVDAGELYDDAVGVRLGLVYRPRFATQNF